MKSNIILQLCDISKYYKNNMIFNNINLTVNKGEVVSIIGKSGCGKSSLLKCINKLEKIQQGKIFIYNHDVENIKVEDLRKRVGIVFQDYNLFSHLTVIENLTIGLMKLKKMTKSESIKKAEEILKKIDLIDKKNNYPDELSGGQQQRVAIARTILMKPNLILLDEPTSALDKESKNSVFDMIKELVKENMTMIIVSHEEQFVEEISDRIFKLNKHELKEMKK
ncbi:MAG TPA: amino acid ABC transporter ATP-binding protein [Bacilli bacterium]|nr:amino acid ABC transporter ATP-binding protein [Bacilli bacterium]